MDPLGNAKTPLSLNGCWIDGGMSSESPSENRGISGTAH